MAQWCNNFVSSNYFSLTFIKQFEIKIIFGGSGIQKEIPWFKVSQKVVGVVKMIFRLAYPIIGLLYW